MGDIFNLYINKGVGVMVQIGGHALLPILCAAFVFGVIVRLVIFLTVKAEAAFAMEFEKRVHKYLADPKYEPNVPAKKVVKARVKKNTVPRLVP